MEDIRKKVEIFMTTSSSWHLGMEGWQGALVSPCQVFCVKLLGTCRARLWLQFQLLIQFQQAYFTF